MLSANCSLRIVDLPPRTPEELPVAIDRVHQALASSKICDFSRETPEEEVAATDKTVKAFASTIPARQMIRSAFNGPGIAVNHYVSKIQNGVGDALEKGGSVIEWMVQSCCGCNRKLEQDQDGVPLLNDLLEPASNPFDN